MNHPNPNPKIKRWINSIPAQPHQQVTTSTIAPISRSALTPGSRSHAISTRMRKRVTIIQQTFPRSPVGLGFSVSQKLERIEVTIKAIEVDVSMLLEGVARKWRLL